MMMMHHQWELAEAGGLLIKREIDKISHMYRVYKVHNWSTLDDAKTH